MFSVQCSVFSVQCSVFSIQYSVFSIQYSVFSIQYSVFSDRCQRMGRAVVVLTSVSTRLVWMRATPGIGVR